MSDKIAYLPRGLADTLRTLVDERNHDQTWKLTRLVERAYAEGYDMAYMRGYHDGYGRGRADEAGAIADEES